MPAHLWSKFLSLPALTAQEKDLDPLLLLNIHHPAVPHYLPHGVWLPLNQLITVKLFGKRKKREPNVSYTKSI